MMRSIISILIISAFALFTTVANAANPLVNATNPVVDVTSTWVNELGSTMTITFGSGGSVTGTYVSKVGCGAGNPFPLTGWYNDQAITFTVNWQQCNSLTAWTGHYVITSGKGQFVTLWYLSVGGTPAWNSTVAGTDTFTLQ